MTQPQEVASTIFVAFFVSVLALLIFLGALSIDRAAGSPTSTTVIAHFLLNTLVVLAALFLAVRARPFSLHLFHLVGVLIFACVACLYQYIAGDFPLAGPVVMFRAEIPRGCLVVTLWLLAYLAGYYIRLNLVAAWVKSRFTRSFEKPVSVAGIYFSLVVGFVSLLYLASLGLLGAFTRAAATESLSTASNSSIVLINTIFVRALPLLAVAGTALALRRGRMSLGIGFLIPLFIIEVVGVLLTNSPFAAARYWFVAVVVGLAAPHFLANRRTGIPILVLAILGFSVLPSLGQARNAETVAEILQHYFVFSSPFEYLSRNGDVDAFGMMCLAIKWLDIHGPAWGMQTLGSVLFWVPRAIWPAKPIGTGAMVSESLGFDFTNFSVPIMTEPLVDFGLIGVPFFSFAFGWLLASIDRSYWSPFDSTHYPAGIRRIDVVYPFWVGLMLFMTRGDLMSSFGYTVGITLAILPFVMIPPRFKASVSSEARVLPGAFSERNRIDIS